MCTGDVKLVKLAEFEDEAGDVWAGVLDILVSPNAVRHCKLMEYHVHAQRVRESLSTSRDLVRLQPSDEYWADRRDPTVPNRVIWYSTVVQYLLGRHSRDDKEPMLRLPASTRPVGDLLQQSWRQQDNKNNNKRRPKHCCKKMRKDSGSQTVMDSTRGLQRSRVPCGAMCLLNLFRG